MTFEFLNFKWWMHHCSSCVIGCSFTRRWRENLWESLHVHKTLLCRLARQATRTKPCGIVPQNVSILFSQWKMNAKLWGLFLVEVTEHQLSGYIIFLQDNLPVEKLLVAQEWGTLVCNRICTLIDSLFLKWWGASF